MTARWYYDNCKEFQEYVDRVCNSRKLPVDEVLKFVITKEYLKMLMSEGRAEKC